MITIEIFKGGAELILLSADKKFTGYGHYQVTVDMMYKGEEKSFKATTTNMEEIDKSREAGVESWEDAKMILFETIEYQIQEEIEDWIAEVDWHLENE